MSDELYRELILDHYKHPRNAGRLTAPTHAHKEHNPSCGDVIDMTLLVGEGGRVEDVRFEGRGCAVSQASASLLTEKVKGMAVDGVKALKQEDVFAMLAVPVHGSRIKCALLPLKALHKALIPDT
jgi:nitrogen fixation NifU-like protein